MTDLKMQIDIVRDALNPLSALTVSDARKALDAIEAALFPESGPAPDPKTQFVVGERYRHLGGTPRQCLFVFSDGSMAYEDRGQPRGSSFAPFEEWQFVASIPELDTAIAERDSAKASLASAEARVAELGGE